MSKSLYAVLILFVANAWADQDLREETPPQRHSVIVKYKTYSPDLLERVQGIDGVTEVSVILGNIHVITFAKPEQKQSVRAALGDIGEIDSILDDKLIRFDGRVGSFSKSLVSPASAPSNQRFESALQAVAIVPGDPRFSDQWYLHNTGQFAATPGLDINAPEAWEVATGAEGSIVAILGSGVDYTHEDLVDSMWVNAGEIPGNNIDDDENGYVDDVYGINTFRNDGNPMDENGLGTAQAGIIAAQTNNGIGISGISWKTKILSCNFMFRAGVDFFSYYSDVIECFEYVVRLRKKTGANITSVVIATGGNEFVYAYRDIATQLDSLGILLIIAAPGTNGTDISPEFPLGYDLPNTLVVQPLGRRLYAEPPGLASTYARRSVHSIAPGELLLTTFPGTKPDHDSAAIYTESFEPGTDWVANPQWTYTTAEAHSGSQSVALSLTNESIAPVHVVSPSIDLSNYINQPLGVSLKVKSPILWGQTGRVGYVRIGITAPGLNYWEYLDGRAEESQGWRNFHFTFQPWIKSVVTDPSQVRFRVEFSRDALEPAEIYVDDFSIGIIPVVAPSNDYVLFSGSAAAAAVVAGAVELAKAAKPTAAASQLKNIVTSTGFKPQIGDPAKLAQINNEVLLWGPAGTGVVNCAGVGFVRRTWPKVHVYTVTATGQESRLRAVSTDCGNPGAAPVMQRDDGGPAIVLADDGSGYDLRPGDGDFAGSWSRLSPGATALSLAGDIDVLYETLDSYDQVTEIPFEWRDMSSAPGGNVIPAVPFPIKFGNHPVGLQDDIEMFDLSGNIRVHHVGVSEAGETAESKGEVSYWNTRGSMDASGVPVGTDSFGVSVLAAGTLTDPLSTMGRLRVDVLGEAPNREWVIQYHNLTVKKCITDQNLKAQVIFFENSSDIQMNFLEYSNLCGDSSWRPTVGIQYNDLAFTRYEGPISNETSLLFTAEPYDGNLAPVAIEAVAEVVVTHSVEKQVDLAAFFSDPDGDPLTFYLADEGLSPGISINGNILSARTELLANDAGFVERFIYASDGEFAAKMNLRLILQSNSNFPPQLVAELPVPVVYYQDFAQVPLAGYFVDPEGDPFEFIAVQFPEGYTISSNGYFGGGGSSQLATGLHEVKFRVRDRENSSTFTMWFEFRGARANLPPEVVDPIGIVNVEVGKMFRVSLEERFVDPNGDSLFFSFASNPSIPLLLGTIPENLLGGVPSASWLAGSPHNIPLTVWDGTEAIQHDFTVVVTDPSGIASAAQDPSAAPVEEVTVSAPRKSISGGGSFEVWVILFLLILTAMNAGRRATK